VLPERPPRRGVGKPKEVREQNGRQVFGRQSKCARKLVSDPAAAGRDQRPLTQRHPLDSGERQAASTDPEPTDQRPQRPGSRQHRQKQRVHAQGQADHQHGLHVHTQRCLAKRQGAKADPGQSVPTTDRPIGAAKHRR
jgi:hypothetical protein